MSGEVELKDVCAKTDSSSTEPHCSAPSQRFQIIVRVLILIIAIVALVTVVRHSRWSVFGSSPSSGGVNDDLVEFVQRGAARLERADLEAIAVAIYRYNTANKDIGSEALASVKPVETDETSSEQVSSYFDKNLADIQAVRNPQFDALMASIRAGNVEVADFTGLNLGDREAKEIAAVLRNNTKVLNVWVNENNIGPVGAWELASILQHNKVLTVLGCRSNKFGNEGVRVLARALANNTVLKTLFVGDNGIDGVGAFMLAEALLSNKNLSELGLLDDNICPLGLAALNLAVAKRGTPLNILQNCDPRVRAQ